MDLSGKTAIITGASSGIGRAAAHVFAAAGAALIVGARRATKLQTLVSEIAANGGLAVPIAGDVADEDYARALVDAAAREFGGLDIAFNNAGLLGRLAPIADVTAADWQQTLGTNLTGAFLGAKH